MQISNQHTIYYAFHMPYTILGMAILYSNFLNVNLKYEVTIYKFHDIIIQVVCIVLSGWLNLHIIAVIALPLTQRTNFLAINVMNVVPNKIDPILLIAIIST